MGNSHPKSKNLTVEDLKDVLLGMALQAVHLEGLPESDNSGHKFDLAVQYYNSEGTEKLKADIDEYIKQQILSDEEVYYKFIVDIYSKLNPGEAVPPLENDSDFESTQELESESDMETDMETESPSPSPSPSPSSPWISPPASPSWNPSASPSPSPSPSPNPLWISPPASPSWSWGPSPTGTQYYQNDFFF